AHPTAGQRRDNTDLRARCSFCDKGIARASAADRPHRECLMGESASNAAPPSDSAPWYRGVTRCQWLVLAIASAGWIFDVYEGHIFTITRNQVLADVLHVQGTDPAIKRYGDVLLGVFLLGGTVGGLLFGSLADRWGRRPTMVATILVYSLFSGLTFLADS